MWLIITVYLHHIVASQFVAAVAWSSKVQAVLALAGLFTENIDTIVDAVDDDLAEFALRCEFEVGP